MTGHSKNGKGMVIEAGCWGETSKGCGDAALGGGRAIVGEVNVCLHDGARSVGKKANLSLKKKTPGDYERMGVGAALV